MNREERRRRAATQRFRARTPAATLAAPKSTVQATAIRRDPTEVPPGWARSGLPHVSWPAIQTGSRGEALAVQFQLEQTQWWSAERIRAHQFAQLAELVRHAGETVPFYRERFREIGFDHRAPLDEASWSTLPCLGRRDIQDSAAQLHSGAYPTRHGTTGRVGTSGSTAAPISVQKTRLQQLFWEAVGLRDHLWQRRSLAGRHATIASVHRIGEAAYPEGRQHPNWGDTVAPFRTGDACSLAITTRIEHQAEWLARMKPDYLNTYPSNLDALARHCRDSRMTLPSLRGLRSNSEILRPETRDLCRSAFGLEVADMYSSAEVGYMALQSPVAEELLVQAETILVEVLDDRNRPCAPGQIGRVIVTPLHAFAMPLLRYESGDLAEAGGPAQCGRGLPVLKRVIGREREMIRLPTGQRFWPSFPAMWRQFPEIRQFQIVRKAEELIEIRLVVRAPLDVAAEASLKQHLQDRLGYPFEIRIAYCDEIPREPSGKYFDFKSEVD